MESDLSFKKTDVVVPKKGCHRAKRGDTLASISDKGESNSPRRSPSPAITKESQERGRLPHTLEDDVLLFLGMKAQSS